MRLTVLGGCGAYPEAGQACSGYLVEHDGFRLLVDLGYAVVPQLLGHLTAADVDAVFISHGHPDHCADLNPLLRARLLGGETLPPLPVYALPGALDAVLALDRPGMLDDGYVLHELTPGGSLDIGPFGVRTRLLPHTRPNAGARLTAGGKGSPIPATPGLMTAWSPWLAALTCCWPRPASSTRCPRIHGAPCPARAFKAGRLPRQAPGACC